MTDYVLNKVLYGEISLIGIIFTAIIMKKSISIGGFKATSRSQRVFVYLLGTMILMFFWDGFTWIIDGITFSGSRVIYTVCMTLYFMMNPMIGFLWNMYVHTKLYSDINHIRRSMMIYTFPFVINVVLCIISLFNGCIFSVDENGVYSRGELHPINMAMSFMYYMISLLVILIEMYRNEKIRNNRDFKYLLLFPLSPLIGTVVQTVFYGVSVVYISVLVSFLVIFINVQNEQIYSDSATGLRNKKYLNTYMTEKISNLRKNTVLGVVLIDLDYFKVLNDTYGHTVGDRALRDMSDILRYSFDTNADCISRFGGDEFVVSLVRENEEKILEEISRLKENIRGFNESGRREYKLSFSVGHAVYDRNGAKSVDELLKCADTEMYADKSKNHSEGRVQPI